MDKDKKSEQKKSRDETFRKTQENLDSVPKASILALSRSVPRPLLPKADDFTFINNKYTKRRGEPKMLTLFCMCNNYVLTYQKDGPGNLLRCYLDRIHHPEKLRDLASTKFNVKDADNLECDECKTAVAVPIIYAPEKRPAYGLLHNKTYFKPA